MAGKKRVVLATRISGFYNLFFLQAGLFLQAVFSAGRDACVPVVIPSRMNGFYNALMASARKKGSVVIPSRMNGFYNLFWVVKGRLVKVVIPSRMNGFYNLPAKRKSLS